MSLLSEWLLGAFWIELGVHVLAAIFAFTVMALEQDLSIKKVPSRSIVFAEIALLLFALSVSITATLLS